MLLSDKLLKWNNFKQSAQFGNDTYLSLIVYGRNLYSVINTIEAYFIMLEGLENNTIKLKCDQKNLLQVKQHISLDILFHIMIVIETTVVLCHALSKNYVEVPQTMTYYRTNLVDEIFKNIKNKKYDLEKILGLPKLQYLNLSVDEQNILQSCYKETTGTFSEVLMHWMDFYENFRIIYNKSKHGLALMTGGGVNADKQVPEFSKSHLVAFTSLTQNKMPPRTFFIPSKDVKKLDSTWFKTQSFMKFLPELFSQMKAVLTELKDYGTYISRNHLLYAKNCGEDYLPYKDDAGIKEFGIFPGLKYSENEQRVIDRLIRDIVPNMNHEKKGIQYDHTSNHEQLNNSMKNDVITNIFFE
ncbi:protein of unknown function [Nitrosotalea devaniterrae]|uniref:Uncharacterized protein n=1 Tax=Nitrosotalea devaniterrae TaxID=1078905 RepID=A0A128A370_9ARCH|nr:protein of unknown function [Candidatus Nitrosotalea devanaterra]